MKKTRLFKRLILGAACLLGIGAGGTVMAQAFTPQDIVQASATTETKTETINAAIIAQYCTYEPYRYMYGSFYLKWANCAVDADNNAIDIAMSSSDFEFRSPSIIRSVQVGFSSAIDKDTDANVNNNIEVRIDGLGGSKLVKTGNNCNFTGINQQATITIEVQYMLSTDWEWARLNNFYITVTRDKANIVTFDMNGHGTAPATQEVGAGAKVTQPENPLAVGYLFGGWYKESSCINMWNFGTDTVSVDTTLYAKWAPVTKNVVIDQNGGTGGVNMVSATYDSPMPALSSLPTRTGYDFLGYFDATSGGKKYYNEDGTSARTWDKDTSGTLYAHWQVKTSTVTLDANGGTGGPSAQTATYGQDMPTVSTLPTRVHYLFLGYFDDATGGAKYYNEDGTSATTWDKEDESVTLYAHWELEGTGITLDKQGGTDGSDDVLGIYDQTLPSITIPTRSGYIFNGYYEGPNGQGQQYYNANGVSSYVWDTYDETATFYASWTIKEAVQAVIDKIDGIGEVSYPGSGDSIDAARAAYNALDEGDKGGVSNYATLTTAESTYDSLRQAGVDAVEDLIDAIGVVALDSENDIVAARTAYNALTEEQQGLVTNYDDLLAAEARLEELKVAKAEADEVVNLINAIGEVSYHESHDDIKAARDAFDALSVDAKTFVDNINVLTQAEADYSDLRDAAINNVEDLIDAIGVVSYPDSKDDIDAARAAYEALYETDKSEVSNYQDLLDAEALYNPVDKFVKHIDSLDPKNTQAYRDSVVEGFDLANALTDEQRSIVPQSYLETLKEHLDALAVIYAIDDIGEVEHTDACKARIVAAREAYDALTDAEQGIVKKVNYDVLLAAEAMYDHVDKTYNKIEDIGEHEYTDEYKNRIVEARSSYDGLTDDEKELVTNYDKLLKAEQDYAAVDGLVKDIEAIDVLTFGKETKKAIEDAREAYENLTDDQNDFFPEDTLKHLQDLEKAYGVIELIHDIGEVDYTSECKGKIDDAREAYEALTDVQKALISEEELQILIDAEEVYESMDKIKNIGSVEYTTKSKQLIDDARKYYNSLDEAQKKMVDSNILAKLANAEKAYESMNKIHAIGTVENSKASKDKIDDARSYYDGLTAEQKALISKEELQILTDAENVYECMTLIDKIGDVSYTYESRKDIEQARQYYESLTPEQKQMVGNAYLGVLTNSEEAYTNVESTSNGLLIAALIVIGLGLVGAGIWLFFILKNRNKNNGGDDDNKGNTPKAPKVYKPGKKSTKLASFSGLLPMIYATSHYVDGPWIALYILAGLTVLFLLADVILFFYFRKRKGNAPVVVKDVRVPEKVEEKPAPQPVVQEASSNNEEEDEVVTVTDAKGNIFQIRFIKSFTAKLIQSPDETKKYYEELKNEVLSYKKVNARLSWNYDSLNSGRNQVLKFAVRGKTLCVYFPLNADDYEDSKYKVEKVESKKFEDVPCLYRIKNDRRCAYAKELIAVVAEKLGLVKGEEQHESYYLHYEDNKPLIARGLIKELKVQVNKPVSRKTQILSIKVNDEGDEIVTKKDSQGNIFEIRFIKSFTAKLSQSSDEVKNYYNVLKNYVLSYKKANSRVSWHYDSINVGREQVLKFSIRGKTLCVYYALNADDYAESKYKVEKVESKKFEDVPCLYRIKNDRRCSYAQELIDVVMQKFNVEKGKESNEDFRIKYEETKVLLEKGLIKEVKTKVSSAPEVHESISVSEADQRMSDEIAEASIKEDTSSKKHEGKKGIINIDTIGENFNDGDLVDIEALWKKKLIPSNVGYVKVLARGTLNKKLNLDLQDYSLQAVKMILLEGGSVKKAK